MSSASTVRDPHAAHAAPPRRSSPASELVFDTFFGGVLGASAIALFFLVVDVVQGRPLFTPSLIGTVLFTGASPAGVTGVRLDMVAYFTLVHFAVFGALGAGISGLCRRWALAEAHPLVVAATVFVILTSALALGDLLLMRGVVSAIGLGIVLAANAVAGLAMGAFIRWSHRM